MIFTEANCSSTMTCKLLRAENVKFPLVYKTDISITKLVISVGDLYPTISCEFYHFSVQFFSYV